MIYLLLNACLFVFLSSVIAMQYDSSVPDTEPALIAQKEQKTNLPSSKKMMKNHFVDDDAAMLI